MPSVVFMCVANSCRSQMAEAVAKSVAGAEWEIWSAGSHPSGHVNPTATTLMQELGLDLRSHQSKGVDALPKREWDYVVAMGCGDSCQTLAAKTRLDWDIPDPVGLPVEKSRAIRDQIRGLVQALITTGGA